MLACSCSQWPRLGGNSLVKPLKVRGIPRLAASVTAPMLATGPAACVAGQQLDARRLVTQLEGDLEQQLGSLNADLLVDASGPFHQYGAQPYRLIQACIAHRISYLDLADGSDFVAAVKQFDVAAREAGIFILSGVSSFPVLTAAVVRRLSTGFATVDSIRGGIAPSPYAGVGDNVIRAIASYAGQPIRLRPMPLRLGPWSNSYEYADERRFRFDVQIGHPVAGLIVRYRGWLMPTTTLPAYTSDSSSASVPAHETASASGS